MNIEEAKSYPRGTRFTIPNLPYSVWFDGDTCYRNASNIEVTPPETGYVKVGRTSFAVLQDNHIKILIKNLTHAETLDLKWDLTDILEYLEWD